MPLALQKSTDGGATFQQVSVDVADYTLPLGNIATYFLTTKDSQNNTYVLCGYNSQHDRMKIIKISSMGIKTVSWLDINNSAQQSEMQFISLSRDEQTLFFTALNNGILPSQPVTLFSIPTNFSAGSITPTPLFQVWSYNGDGRIAIYQDRYIWVASGITIKIYNYDTKAELASVTAPVIGGTSLQATYSICCSSDNTCYFVANCNGFKKVGKAIFNANPLSITASLVSEMDNDNDVYKQLLIDRFGDLIILTNTGTASTLLKYSNTGTLIDTVSLSVGTNKGAYGLQVYSSDNGTKCWVQFSNDLGTWRTEAKSYDATPANRTFGAVSKLRDNGVTVYGNDHGSDNNYSVRC